MAFHDLEVQKKVLQDEALQIIEEASEEEEEDLRRHEEVHSMNLSEVSVEERP